MGIVHGEAGYLPDFLDYFSTKFPSAPVKMEILGKKDIETTTMLNFYAQVSLKVIRRSCEVSVRLKFNCSLAKVTRTTDLTTEVMFSQHDPSSLI